MTALTYAQFHALFLVPPLFVLSAVSLWQRPRARLVRPIAVAIITGVALVYTTPWDNLLILAGVWEYGDGTVVARLWAAPVEEYAFFLIQPLVGALWLHVCSLVFDPPESAVSVSTPQRVAGVLAAVPIGGAGALMLTADATLYMGAILLWAAPVLALQWAVGWPYLWARRKLVAAAVAVPTLYLSAADRVAIENGVWIISPEFTTGLTVLGLPVEEGAFFFLTTVFVVQGLVLYPWVVDRWL